MATVYANNLEIQINQPLDTRFVCDQLSDLTEYLYVGLQTYCKADGSYYELTSLDDSGKNPEWKKLNAVSSTNLIKNSNFENTNPGGTTIGSLLEGWSDVIMTSVGDPLPPLLSTIVQNSHNNKYNAIHVVRAGASLDLQLKVDKTYTLSFDYKGDGGKKYLNYKNGFVAVHPGATYKIGDKDPAEVSSLNNISLPETSGFQKVICTFKPFVTSNATKLVSCSLDFTYPDKYGGLQIACLKLEEGDTATEYDRYEDTWKNIRDYKLSELSNDIKNIENDLVDLENQISVKYEELVALKNANKLIPGVQYKITDYRTTIGYNNHNPNTGGLWETCANHDFDIIVTAESVDSLSHLAKAARKAGDIYFANCDLDAWQLWYDLDNDKTKYDWAATNGKGVIYRMIDEHGNDCPYDFKNILFTSEFITDYYRELDNTSYDSARYTFNYIDASGKEYDATVHTDVCKYNIIKECYGKESGKFTSCRILNKITFRLNQWSINFGGCSQNTLDINCCDILFEGASKDNSFGRECQENVIGSDGESNIFGSYSKNNVIKAYCTGNNFGLYSERNVLESECWYNIFGHRCTGNTIGEYSCNNKFGDECVNNSIASNCSGNTLMNNCELNFLHGLGGGNILGTSCKSNEIWDSCYDNTLGVFCVSNSIGTNSDINTFGNYCKNNDISEGCTYNSLGDSCENNNLGDSCENNNLGDSCKNNNLGDSCTDNSFGNGCTNNQMHINCSFNIIGNSCKDNTFGRYSIHNSLNDKCDANAFGVVTGTIAVSHADYVKLDENCTNNTFGQGSTHLELSPNCSRNKFGISSSEPLTAGGDDNYSVDGSKYIKLGESFENNTFYDRTKYITLEGKSGDPYDAGTQRYGSYNESNNNMRTSHQLEYYIDINKKYIPVKYPDIYDYSGTPNILPYTFFGNYVYESWLHTGYGQSSNWIDYTPTDGDKPASYTIDNAAFAAAGLSIGSLNDPGVMILEAVAIGTCYHSPLYLTSGTDINDKNNFEFTTMGTYNQFTHSLYDGKALMIKLVYTKSLNPGNNADIPQIPGGRPPQASSGPGASASETSEETDLDEIGLDEPIEDLSGDEML